MHDPISRTRLLDLPVGLVEDLRHQHAYSTRTAEAFSSDYQVCLPYRGIFVWHVGRDEVVADVNQVLWVTAGESYRLSSPLPIGYAELIITPRPAVLAELMGASRPLWSAQRRSWRVSPALQSVCRRFLHWATGVTETLEAEEAVVTLLRTALQDYVPRTTTFGPATRRLIRRTKEVLEAERSNRLSLSDVGHAVGASPVYLTDVFRRAEGVSLHRYLTQLRLAHALIELPNVSDLTALALALGFSSHSHFTALFRKEFGLTPSRFRESTRRGEHPWLHEPYTHRRDVDGSTSERY